MSLMLEVALHVILYYKDNLKFTAMSIRLQI